MKAGILVLQALHGLSLAQTSYLVRDRLSWMRFCGLGLGDAVPDENTPKGFPRDADSTGALEKLFERLNAAIAQAGYLAMGGQTVDASIMEVPKQRNTKEKKGRHQGWPYSEIMARQATQAALEGHGWALSMQARSGSD